MECCTHGVGKYPGTSSKVTNINIKSRRRCANANFIVPRKDSFAMGCRLLRNAERIPRAVLADQLSPRESNIVEVDSTKSGFFEGFQSSTELRLQKDGNDWGLMRYACHDDVDDRFARLEIRLSKTIRDKGDFLPVVVHWAMSTSFGGSWSACPYGWETTPGHSWDSGNNAWETESSVINAGKYSASFKIPKSRKLNWFVCVLRTIDREWMKVDHSDIYIKMPLDLSRSTTKERIAASNSIRDYVAISDDVVATVLPTTRKDHDWNSFLLTCGELKADGDGMATKTTEAIAAAEPDSERSLMHRYSNVTRIICKQSQSRNALLSILIWLRLASARKLVWNKNYNVKPREIAVEQERCGRAVSNLFRECDDIELLRLLVAAIGRGGSSEAGQRIRDEILHIQRDNDCKGGMMEEWHQKLHNNTSPDDVIICEALLAFLESNLDLKTYWNVLNRNGVTKERMLSYDRKICSEPSFRPDQISNLRKDLNSYLCTLKAVHGGDDLNSAAEAVLGYYRSDKRGKAVGVAAVDEVATKHVKGLLAFLISCQKFGPPESGPGRLHWLTKFLSALTECRAELFSFLSNPDKLGDRFLDVVVLDISLDSTARHKSEELLQEIKVAPLKIQMLVLNFLLRSIILSSGNNKTLIDIHSRLEILLSDVLWDVREDSVWETFNDADKEILSKLMLSLRNEISLRSETMMAALDSAGIQVTKALGLDRKASEEIKESIVRGGTAAVLSQVLDFVRPNLRTKNSGNWTIVSNGNVNQDNFIVGRVLVVETLSEVELKSFDEPTILVVRGSVSGDEDVPAGAVAVFTTSTVDILCHLAVRARTERVLVGIANEGDPGCINELYESQGRFLKVKTNEGHDDIHIESASNNEGKHAIEAFRNEISSLMKLTLKLSEKKWCGDYILEEERWSADNVGAKALNLKQLRFQLPNEISVPTGIAIPYGVCEEILENPINLERKKELESLGKLDSLKHAGEKADIMLHLIQPKASITQMEIFTNQYRSSFQSLSTSSVCFDEMWQSILRVWSSKYNQRALLACRKAGLNHYDLSMSVLVQEAIDAKYAFVVHTQHPITNSPDDMYCELVAGLGETLVGNFKGNALAFTIHKPTLSFTINKFPTKEVVMRLRKPTLIFRSDSNCEDLPGFAGAGLFDSIFLSSPEEEPHNYDEDDIVCDSEYRFKIMRLIAETSKKVEEAFGGKPQDIEGVIDGEGKISIVQSRPQMV